MAIIETGKCKIEYLNDKGLGVGKTALGEVILPYVLPGEIVEFERHKYRSNSNCLLKAIEKYSDKRISPTCPYFSRCGGCALQHLEKEEYNKFKQKIISNHLAKHNIHTKINPIITVPPGNRRRANFFALKKHDQIYMGFRKFHSHQIVNIDFCPAILPNLSSLIIPIKKFLHQILDDNQQTQIFLTQAFNGIDLLFELETLTSIPKIKKSNLEGFCSGNNIIRLKVKNNNLSTILYQTAEPYVIFDGIKVSISDHCFLQASSLSDNILQNLLLSQLANKPTNSKLVDLFCGRGTYTLALSKYFKVDAFELDAIAIESLFNVASSANLPINVNVRDLFNSPLVTQELNNYQTAIINPPRAGAEKQIEQFSGSTVNDILYVSCNIESFAKEAKMLLDYGYYLKSLTPIDQFYWTPHIEIFGCFKKQ